MTIFIFGDNIYKYTNKVYNEKYFIVTSSRDFVVYQHDCTSGRREETATATVRRTIRLAIFLSTVVVSAVGAEELRLSVCLEVEAQHVLVVQHVPVRRSVVVSGDEIVVTAIRTDPLVDDATA